MPYIDQARRDYIDEIELVFPSSVGELNYCITRLVDYFLKTNRLNYQNLNAAVGVLECAKLELYRRVAAPYEQKKLGDNGDVYSPELVGE